MILNPLIVIRKKRAQKEPNFPHTAIFVNTSEMRL